MNKGTGRGQKGRGNRGRPPNPSAWLRAPLNLPQGPLNLSASNTTSSTSDGSLNQHQHPVGPLQPITRFCHPRDDHTPGAAPSTHSFMDKRFMAHVLRLLQDASPSHREQLFWDVFTQLAEYFGQPYLPLRNPPDYRSLTRLVPRPQNQLTQYDPTPSNRYAEEFEEVKLLGVGGFGQVVMAKNRLDGCLYAIKMIALEDHGDMSPNRNLQEVRALAQLNHPRVVRYHNAWLQLHRFPYHGMPWTHVSASSSGSYRDMDGSEEEEEEEEALSETSSDANDDDDGGDSIVFQSSAGGQGQGHSLRRHTQSQSNRNSHNHTAEGMANKALLPYKHPQTEPCPRQVLYIQMGLCGESMKDWLEQRNDSTSPVACKRCLEIFRELLEALSYIHKQGLIHRDVKPANILFTLEGHHIQLGDFGLAKQGARPPTSLASASNLVPYNAQRNTCHVGTPLYTAPEANKGIYGQKSDMFSTGVILQELFSSYATNHERVNDIQSLINKRHLDPELRRRFPIITDYILRLTDPDPAQRPSAEELLASSLFSQPFPPPPQPPPPSPSTTDTTITKGTAPPGPADTSGTLIRDGAVSDVQNFQCDVNNTGTLNTSPMKNYETLKFNHIKTENSVAINVIERCLSRDEENAVLREENFSLKRRVEELELEVQRLKATNSTLPMKEK